MMEIDYDDYSQRPNMEIIDLRNELSNMVNLPDAKRISFDSLILYPSKYLLKDKSYLLVCDFGIKSKKTSEILNHMGYQTYSLKRGIHAFLNKKIKED